jgi:hypothetical protein
MKSDERRKNGLITSPQATDAGGLRSNLWNWAVSWHRSPLWAFAHCFCCQTSLRQHQQLADNLHIAQLTKPHTSVWFALSAALRIIIQRLYQPIPPITIFLSRIFYYHERFALRNLIRIKYLFISANFDVSCVKETKSLIMSQTRQITSACKTHTIRKNWIF